MIECLSAVGGADLYNNWSWKVTELSKLAKVPKGLKCFKVADCTNSNIFVNAAPMSLLKKYIDLIHKAKELSRKWKKRDPKLLHCVIDELIALIASA